MKKKHLINLGCLVVLVVAYVISIIPNIRFHREWDSTVAALRGLPRERVDAAVQAFIHDQKPSATLPASVSFAELVSGGYLHTNDVVAFGGKQAEVFLGADGSDPGAVWVRVHLTDTRDAVECEDGSIMLAPRL